MLGVDGGSTTTKVALVDAETMQIAAAHYGRTHGDPVAALKRCLAEVRGQIGGARPRVSLVATTGSSRELLGVFLETSGVYNEIIAHAAGTTCFEPDVDTLFEIGGQDAKYVLLNNGVPIDYAMNEACSAGTGSFLEESAAGDLRIERAEEIGPIALEAAAPLKFGEHCSAFINSDIRKAIQGGASRPDIVAGLVFSIVANYLNRVVGSRHVGRRIALQGGVAKNSAVPLAFAQLLGKPVSVPPDPELMGCFGVARLALQKHREGLLAKGDFDLEALAAKDMLCVGAFTCQACDNSCEIRNLAVDGRRYPFGGRCSKFTSVRRPRPAGDTEAVDHVAWRTEELFARSAPRLEDFRPRSDRTVGVPLALSVHSLWPLYARFFHDLGVRTVISNRVLPEGIARQESSYCFPVEIAHGAIQDLVDKGVDYLFLPHFRDMPSMEAGKVHACTCPLTQGLPYLARQAFGVDDTRPAARRVLQGRMAGMPSGVHAGGGATGVRVRRGGPRLRPRGRGTPRVPRALPAARARGDGGDPGPSRPPVCRAVRPSVQRVHARRQHGDPAEVHLPRGHGRALRPDLRRGRGHFPQHVLVLRPAGHEGP